MTSNKFLSLDLPLMIRGAERQIFLGGLEILIGDVLRLKETLLAPWIYLTWWLSPP
jgi:hypothetical protein